MIGEFWLFLKGIERETWAIFIAALAIISTVWQGYIARRHNRLSVKPLLGFHYKLKSVNGYYGIDIENRGLGAAIINKLYLYVGGKFIGHVNSEKVWTTGLTSLFSDSVVQFSCKKLTGKCTIKEGESLNILKFPDCNRSEKEMASKLELIEFEVKLESIYGEKFTEHSSK